MRNYTFRCASISEEGYFHTINVPETGHVVCTCMGQSWCSHIEATLVAGERHMIPPTDRAQADLAQIAAKDRIGPTEDWKSNWRSHRRWRGLPQRQSNAQKLMHLGNPIVSIEGRPTLRRKAEEIAAIHEWFVNPRPTKGVLIHIAENKQSTTHATNHARNIGLMIATHDEWPTIAPIGKTLHNHIQALLSEEKYA